MTSLTFPSQITLFVPESLGYVSTYFTSRSHQYLLVLTLSQSAKVEIRSIDKNGSD